MATIWEKNFHFSRWLHKFLTIKQVFLYVWNGSTWVDCTEPLSQTLPASSGWMWNAECETDLITHYLCRISAITLWLNENKSISLVNSLSRWAEGDKGMILKSMCPSPLFVSNLLIWCSHAFFRYPHIFKHEVNYVSILSANVLHSTTTL